MKRQTPQQPTYLIKIIIALVAGAALLMISFSFTVHKKMADDFLKQLGISKADANSKISNSLLFGSLDGYGIKNIKNMALGNRTAITKDLLVYTKQYVNSPAFIKEYNVLRDKNKPTLLVLKTPEDMQKETIETNKKNIVDLEAKLKTANATMKSVYEKILVTARQQLKEAEDPNSKSVAGYRKRYPIMVKDHEMINQRKIADWEASYPSNHLLIVKQRLQQFLDETNDIDFSAELYEKKGIKYFTNPAYERKSGRWKMVFRAGKEVVEPARNYVREWMKELM
jgi:hypothetical protein